MGSGQCSMRFISANQPSIMPVQGIILVQRHISMFCVAPKLKPPDLLTPTVVLSWDSIQVYTPYPQLHLQCLWEWDRIMAGGRSQPAMALSYSLRQWPYQSIFLLSLHKTVLNRMVTCTARTPLPTLGAALSTFMLYRVPNNTFKPSQWTRTHIWTLQEYTYSQWIAHNTFVHGHHTHLPGPHTGFPSWHKSQRSTKIAPPFQVTTCHSYLVFPLPST